MPKENEGKKMKYKLMLSLIMQKVSQCINCFFNKRKDVSKLKKILLVLLILMLMVAVGCNEAEEWTGENDEETVVEAEEESMGEINENEAEEDVTSDDSEEEVTTDDSEEENEKPADVPKKEDDSKVETKPEQPKTEQPKEEKPKQEEPKTSEPAPDPTPAPDDGLEYLKAHGTVQSTQDALDFARGFMQLRLNYDGREDMTSWTSQMKKYFSPDSTEAERLAGVFTENKDYTTGSFSSSLNQVSIENGRFIVNGNSNATVNGESKSMNTEIRIAFNINGSGDLAITDVTFY